MDGATLERLRPQNGSADAIRQAFGGIAAERVACDRRAVDARNRRVTALLRGSEWEIGEAERAIAAAARDVEQLDLLEERLAPQLAEAEQREEARGAAYQRAVAEARAAAAAFAARAPEFAKHAAAIAALCELDRAAVAAIGRATDLARASGQAFPDFGARPAVNVGQGRTVALSDVVVLPELGGAPMAMWWGALAQQHVFQPLYAPVGGPIPVR